MKRKAQVRAGFTLIELLVVMAIIAILVALTTAGVMRYLQKIPEIKTRNDISQMSTALETFHVKFKYYPPSMIYLANTLAAYNANPSAADYQFRQRSLQYIMSLWPRLDWTVGMNPPIDWTGKSFSPGWFSNPLQPSDPGYQFATILEGDQCLVFFLRGINGTGFSTNPKNPTQLGGNRVPPFYEFDESRLVASPDITHTVGDNSGLFPSYFDAYRIGKDPTNKPYLYFSSGLRTNGYSAMSQLLPPGILPPGAATDCPTPYPTPAAPYCKPKVNPSDPLQYYNPSSFQIISAGRDQRYGPGGFWTPAAAALIAPPGFDDMCNFYDSFMGVAP